MNYWTFTLILLMLSCKNGCKKDVVKIPVDSLDTKTKNLDPAERIYLDSVKAEDPKLAEKLTGFDKDSLLMRIQFQNAANRMGEAYKIGDINNYLSFMLPGLVKAAGGIQKLKAKYESEMKTNHSRFERILSGPVSELGEVLDEKGKSAGWYCLMPQLITFNQNGRTLQAEGYLVGYSPNANHCYFVDISNMPEEKVYNLMPDLYHIVPELPRRGSGYALP